MLMTQALFMEMAAHNQGEPALVQHLLKVHGFARYIALGEGMDASSLEMLECAALTHDIGIKHCMDRYGNCTGEMQQTEGPPLARAMLEGLGAPAPLIERVCYLISRHHTYTDVDGLDLRILLEADCLVNLFEGDQDDVAKRAAYERIFRTETGKRLFDSLYPAYRQDPPAQ